MFYEFKDATLRNIDSKASATAKLLYKNNGSNKGSKKSILKNAEAVHAPSNKKSAVRRRGEDSFESTPSSAQIDGVKNKNSA